MFQYSETEYLDLCYIFGLDDHVLDDPRHMLGGTVCKDVKKIMNELLDETSMFLEQTMQLCRLQSLVKFESLTRKPCQV